MLNWRAVRRAFVRLLSSALRLTAGLTFIFALMMVLIPALVVLIPWRRGRILIGNLAGKLIGSTCFYLAGGRLPKGVHAEMDRRFPAIYVSNHASMLDVFLGMWLSPWGVCGVAKKEVVWYPFFGLIYLLSGHLRVDRGNRGSAVKSLEKLAAAVKRHNLGVWIWPEGTRSKDGRLMSFKKGFAHLALATRLPIVPVVVSGAHKGWKKGELTFQGVDVDIQVLDPIPTTDWKAETLDQHIQEVQNRFIEKLPEDQRPLVVEERRIAV